MVVIKREDSKYYRLHRSGLELDDYPRWLGKPVDEATMAVAKQAIYKKYGLKQHQVELYQKMLLVEGTTANGEYVLNSIDYDPQYKTYTTIGRRVQSLIPQLYASALWLSVLVIAVNIIIYFLFRQIQSAQEKVNASLEYEAAHDALTKLRNRHYLEQLNYLFSTDDTQQLFLAFLDLNNFKKVNDTYGHRTGDEILKVVAKRIKNSFPDDITIRVGGDEFIIILINQPKDTVEAKLYAFLLMLRKVIQVNDIDFLVTASAGVSRYPEHGKTIDELMRKSDIAMYEAKHAKQALTFFSSKLDEIQQENSKIENALNKALEKEELYLVYQPQVDALTGKILGVETLIRWKNDELGFVPPDQFIPLAEANGMILDIGDFVMKRAFEEIELFWQKVENSPQVELFLQNKLRLSINMSVQQLLSEDFTRDLESYCRQYNNPTIIQTMEITESHFIEDPDRAKEILLQIKAMGFLISLDDFGTGYSSLSILSKLPIDELKIDKSFISDIERNAQALSLAKSIIGLGKSLNIPVLAEGVEERPQAKLLHENGCDSFQGYHYAKPLTIDELSEFIKSYNAIPFG